MCDHQMQSSLFDQPLHFCEILIRPWYKWHLQQKQSCAFQSQGFDLLRSADPVKECHFASEKNLWNSIHLMFSDCMKKDITGCFSLLQKCVDSVLCRIKMRSRCHDVYLLCLYLLQHCQCTVNIPGTVVYTRQDM